MRASFGDLPITMESGAAVSREAEWGAMNVAFERFPAGMDSTPLFRGLPDDACQCPHWGYLLRGRIRIRYTGRDEVIAAGQAYYLSPGHNIVVEEDCELLEFSPKGEYQKTLEVVARNLASAE